MALGSSRNLALLMTIVVVGVVGYWAWIGLKEPPVAEPAAIVTTPAGWIQLDGGHFTLFAPAGSLIRQNPDGSGHILAPNIFIRFRLGAYSGMQEPLKANADYSETPVVIDGRSGQLRSATIDAAQQQALFGGYGRNLFLGLYLPNAVGNATLEMYGTTSSSDERDMIDVIYKTVRFRRGH